MTSTSKSRGSKDSSNSNNSNSRSNSRSSENKSAFSWTSGNAVPLIGAAVAGAAIGFAANYGRKFATQAMSGATGEWDEVLATEHDMTEALFDKMLATDSSQTWRRKMLLMQITHALDKHAHEEEMVVYPALRRANENATARELNHEHGEIKTYLYELSQMKADDPSWLDKVRQLRDLVVEHARMEEEQVFPRFKKTMTEEQNAKLTELVNKDGFWQA